MNVRDLAEWIDTRAGSRRLWRATIEERLPSGVNWWFTLGGLLLFLLALQAVTGAVLVMFYVPSPAYAWESVRFITHDLPFGRVLRGFHVFGASLIVVAAAVHLLRVIAFGAYKRPRELTWWSGILLLLVILGFALTGYLLPWDQRAYWATVVTINIARTAPLAGPAIAAVLQGGDRVGALTLGRWFGAHVLLLPAALVALVAGHLYLMRRHGIAGPAQPRSGVGRPFYPDHVFRDAVVAGVVFAALMAFTIIVPTPLAPQADPSDATYVPRPEWYFLSLFQLLKYFPGRLEPIGAHVVPAVVMGLLALLPWLDRGDARAPRRRLLVLGLTAVVGAGIVGLTVLAVRDLPPSRPAWGTRALAGMSIASGERCARCHQSGGAGPDLAAGHLARDPGWIEAHVGDPETIAPGSRPAPAGGLRPLEVRAVLAYVSSLRSGEAAPNPFPNDRIAVRVFGTRCIACHVLDGDGSRFGPDLSHVGAHRDPAWMARWIADPSAVDARATMPSFGGQLSPEEIAAVADFLRRRR